MLLNVQAKWFRLLHAGQVFPLAGHIWLGWWVPPHLGHRSEVWAVDGRLEFTLPLGVERCFVTLLI